MGIFSIAILVPDVGGNCISFNFLKEGEETFYYLTLAENLFSMEDAMGIISTVGMAAPRNGMRSVVGILERDVLWAKKGIGIRFLVDFDAFLVLCECYRHRDFRNSQIPML